MLSRKCQLSRVRRLPPVHEQIALQCAKNISRMAVDLPKPTIPTGHVPVLVELRRTDDSSVYYYQVNISADYHDDDEYDEDFTTLIGDISNLKQWLNLATPITEIRDIPPPCPMHGRRSVLGNGGKSTTITKPATNPQFVMTQSALHIVQKPEMKFICKENVATFIELPIKKDADEQTKAHFMASLHGQHASPLDYAELWLPQQDKCWAVQRYAPPPLEIAELYLDENNEYVEKVVTPQSLPVIAAAAPPPPPPPSSSLPPLPQLPPLPPVPPAATPIKLPLLTAQTKQSSNFPLKIKMDQRGPIAPPPPPLPLQQLQQQLQQQQLQQQQQQQQHQQQQQQQQQPLRLLNGYKMDDKIGPKTAELCLNQNGDYVVPHINGLTHNHSKIQRLNGYTKPQKPIESLPPIKNGHKLSMESFNLNQHYHQDRHDRMINIERSPRFSNTNTCMTQSTPTTAPTQHHHNHHHHHHHQPQQQVPLINHYHDHDRRIGHVPHFRDDLKFEPHPERLVTKRVTTLHMQDMLAPEATYPLELQTLFRWNYCDLCRTSMRTVRNAVDHYSSRAHDRRVSSWLLRHCCEQGNASDDVLRYLRTGDPAGYYCRICDLKLTSKRHAQQHLFGRRHHLVARHISKPNGEGYYDDQGRWVRTDTKWLMCELCDVSITSESQMAMHKAGARHRRRVHTTYSGVSLTLNGSHMYRIMANGTLVPLNPFGCYLQHNGACSGSGNGVAMNGMLRQYQPMLTDLHNANGVSAAYYCEICDITLNHMKSVKQHEDGRMHNKKMQRVNIIQAAYA